MMKTLRLLLLLLVLIAPGCALADAERFCDEPPAEALAEAAAYNPYAEIVDYIDIGNGYSFALLSDNGNYSLLILSSAEGKLAYAGGGSGLIPSGGKVFFQRHTAERVSDVRGDDFQEYPDALGYDVIRIDPEHEEYWMQRVSVHFLGGEFRTVGWFDRAQSAQCAYYEGDTLSYYSPTEETFVGSVLLPHSPWFGVLADFEHLPKTYDDAKELAAIAQPAVENAYPGWTMLSYEAYNWATAASVSYLKLDDNVMTVRIESLAAGEGVTASVDSMPVPLSKALIHRLQTEDASALLDAYHYDGSLRAEDAFDTDAIPISGKIIQTDLQQHGLVVLSEDDAGARYVHWVEQADGAYAARTSLPLPRETWLDVFHASANEIQLDWNDGYKQCGFARGADGAWRLAWVMGTADYGVTPYSVERFDESKIVYGSNPWGDLFAIDVSQIPDSFEEAAAQIDRSGWALVNNPDKNDRLHLRTKPDKASDSLGKFYNGTPVQIIETRNGWARVRIGAGEALSGWMMEKYLAFGADMDGVQAAFPELSFSEEAGASRRIYVSPDMKTERLLDPSTTYEVIGLIEGTCDILMLSDGSIGYVPPDWLWEGNG